MLLVVDANVLVGESLRTRGRPLIADRRLELLMAARAWDEAHYELPQRLPALGLSDEVAARLYADVTALLDDRITRMVEEDYRDFERVARVRIPRDPDDWHTVTLALAFGADIWTNDRDFFGCGVATWATETLQPHLASL